MSKRGLYQLDDGTYVRTQGEIPKGQKPRKVEVPIGSQELCDYLNELILNISGSGSPESAQEEEVSVPCPQPPAPPSPQRDIQLQTREQFEEAWDGFPLAYKCQFASSALEDCRELLDPSKFQPIN
jgi:hypothetical protein